MGSGCGLRDRLRTRTHFRRIGQEFDVTRERIRQIEAKALRQLSAPERARRLRALMAAGSVRHPQRRQALFVVERRRIADARNDQHQRHARDSHDAACIE